MIESWPNCPSTRFTKSKPWKGVESVRIKPPACTPAHPAAWALVRVTGVPRTVGVPALIEYGPNFCIRATCCAFTPVGKQAESVAKPAGVGVSEADWNTLLPANKSLSKPPNMNHLFLTMGPPMVPPLNSSLLRGGPVNGVAGKTPGLLLFFWLLLIAFRKLLYSVPNTAPCQALLPLLVMMFTTEPALRPYSGPKLLVTITYCCTKLVSLTNSDGPPTLLSLLFWPSISWSLLRPRRPLDEKPPPFVLEKLSLRVATTPGTNSARRSKPWFSWMPAKVLSVWPENVLLTCDCVVSMSGASDVTSTVVLASPTDMCMAPRPESRPALTTTLFNVAVLKPCAFTSTL